MAYLRISFYELEKATDNDLLAMVTNTHQQISTRTSVFPTPIPTMPAYKDLIDDFQSGIAAAATGDRVMVGQRKLARKALLAATAQLSYYVLLSANGTQQVVLSSGLPMPKAPQPKEIVTPPAPEILPGKQPGEVQMTGKRIAGAAAYMHQHTADAEPTDQSWTTMSCTTAKCKLTNLTPGTVYSFRVGVVGTKDQVLFSPVVSKMVA